MVRRVTRLPVGPDRLWPVLTEPSHASRWLGGRMQWEVTPGSPLRFEPDDDRRYDGRIDAVEPGRLVRWTWWPADDEQAASEVTWTLEPDGDEGTELTVTETPAAASACATTASTGRWTDDDDMLLAAWAGSSARIAVSARVG